MGIIHQLIQSYKKLNFLKESNQFIQIYLIKFIGRFVGPLQKTGLRLLKNLLKPLTKNVLIPLGLRAAALEVDAGIHKKLGWGMTTLRTLNEWYH